MVTARNTKTSQAPCGTGSSESRESSDQGTEPLPVARPAVAAEAHEDREGGEQKLDPANLPDAVLQSLLVLRPGASIRKAKAATADGRVIYKVELEHDDRDIEAELTSQGEVLKVIEEIELASVPAAAMDAVVQLHPQARAREAERQTRGATVIYEITLNENGDEMDVRVTPAGDVLADEEDEDGGEDHKAHERGVIGPVEVVEPELF